MTELNTFFAGFLAAEIPILQPLKRIFIFTTYLWAFLYACSSGMAGCAPVSRRMKIVAGRYNE
jgi:hypothetical protein